MNEEHEWYGSPPGPKEKTKVPISQEAYGIQLGEGQSFGISQRDGKLYIGELDALQAVGVNTEGIELSKAVVCMKRYEISLPAFYLDGDPVDPGIFVKIQVELEAAFEEVTSYEAILHITWTTTGHDGFVYKFDEVMRKCTVTVPDTFVSLLFFQEYKATLQKLLKNEKVVIESFLVSVL